jgi:hypothetical protein
LFLETRLIHRALPCPVGLEEIVVRAHDKARPAAAAALDPEPRPSEADRHDYEAQQSEA